MSWSHQQHQWTQFRQDFSSFSSPTAENNGACFQQPTFGSGNMNVPSAITVSDFYLVLMTSNFILQNNLAGDGHNSSGGFDRQLVFWMLSQATANDLITAQNAAYLALFKSQSN